jgi:Carboxypeptidase regulatory-like domain
MKRAIVAVAILLLSSAPVGAARTGAIEGRVLDGRRDSPVGGAEVVLTIGTDDDVTRQTVRSDERGRFSFDDLATGDDYVYALDARFEGGLFAGGAVRLPADTDRKPVINTTLRVWPTIDDPNAILIRRDSLFVTAGEGGLDVIESVLVLNTSSRAYIGRGTSGISLGFALPAGAAQSGVRIVDSTIDVPEIARTEYGFGITAAIPPGTEGERFTFAYRVPGSAGNYQLGRVALYPVLETSVHATEPLEIAGNRLSESGSVTVGGDSYRRWSTTDALDAGDTLQIQAVAEATGGVWLQAGVAAAIVVAGGLFAVTVWRRRGPGHDGVLEQIAELDLRHDAGEISDDKWMDRRAELKARL